MARKHKFAGASLSIETSLEAATIAQLCEKAAKNAESIQVLLRLEESIPGKLVYSSRNRPSGGRVEFMTFNVVLNDTNGVRKVKTKILQYKVKRSWILVIPMPWQMVAWNQYKKFMYSLQDLVLGADQNAKASVVEIAGVN